MSHQFVNLSVLACCLFSAITVRAEDARQRLEPPCEACYEHPNRYRQAGNPEAISRLAKPSINKHYSGGYVGGGAAFRFGEPRAIDEGTWGMDYSGAVFDRRVWLNWWHGRKYQGGAGAYKTDGPHLKLKHD